MSEGGGLNVALSSKAALSGVAQVAGKRLNSRTAADPAPSAANQLQENLANVEAGNPNWYVYWQQVANQFSHPVSGTFGPHTDVMVYNEDEKGDSDEWASYSPTKLSPWEDKITIHQICHQSISAFMQVLHHENGHRQSYQLPNEYGGWGANLQYDDDEDGEPEGVERDLIHKDWENADPNDSFSMTTDDSKDRSARHHGWEDHADWEEHDPDGDKDPYTNPDWKTECEKDAQGNYVQGLCARNEAHVEAKKDDLKNHDWSHVTNP